MLHAYLHGSCCLLCPCCLFCSCSCYLFCHQAGIASGALASAAVGATNVAGTLIATSLIEGAGRKQLLLSSYLGMATTMALMAAGFGMPSLAGYR
jgi:hypothetical protein